MTLGERIKKVRKNADLTQQAFADRLGIKQNSIALIESGKRNTSDQVILSICREFGVSESWLRTGDGEMITPPVVNELEALARRYPNLTTESLVLIEKLVGLSPEKQNVISGFLREVVGGFGEAEAQADREALHAELDRQLDLEEKPAVSSEVS